MGMSNMVLLNVDVYWHKAYSNISECESFEEFKQTMKRHYFLLAGSVDENYVKDGGLREYWNDFWADFIEQNTTYI